MDRTIPTPTPAELLEMYRKTWDMVVFASKATGAIFLEFVESLYPGDAAWAEVNGDAIRFHFPDVGHPVILVTTRLLPNEMIRVVSRRKYAQALDYVRENSAECETESAKLPDASWRGDS